MLDKTITNALIEIRKQIIRNHLDGLEHVNTLLSLRGVDLSALQVRAKRKPDYSRKGIMRLMVTDALRAGPMRHRDLSVLIAARRPEITPQDAYRRTGKALDKMKLAGLVKHEGRMWGLS